MNLYQLLLAFLCAAQLAGSSPAAIVSIVADNQENFVDIFYTPTSGAEFAAWDLSISAAIGGVLDPFQADRSDNTTDGAALDTLANTVFSSVGAGPASYIFTSYNPGNVFPPVPADSTPVEQLRWTIFDTADGDGDIPGFSPYHMARVLTTPIFAGILDVAFFEGGAAPAPGGVQTVPVNFFSPPVPEPSGILLVSLALLVVFSTRNLPI